MNKIDDSQVRSKINKYVQSLLLGPGSELTEGNLQEEIITEPPTDRYTTGILYSHNTVGKAIENEKESQTGEEDNEINQMVENDFYPKSLGISFIVPDKLKEFNLEVFSAYYTHEYIYSITINKKDFEIVSLAYKELIPEVFQKHLILNSVNRTISIDKQFTEDFIKLLSSIYRSDHTKTPENKILIRYLFKLRTYCSKGIYKRNPVQEKFCIPITEEYGVDKRCWKFEEDNIVKITTLTRPINSNGNIYKSITLSIQNTGENNLFQTNLKIKTSAPLIPSEDISSDIINRNRTDDDLLNELLYRNSQTYALGHGVSVSWDKEGAAAPHEIQTTYMPEVEVKPMSFNIDSLEKYDVLAANNYIDENDNSMFDKISLFIDNYELWVEKENSKVLGLPDHLQNIAAKNIDNCFSTIDRMRKTLSLLKQDPLALKVFCLSQEAMILQRMEHTQEKENAYSTKDYPADLLKWRPFQLAFILSSFESIINEDSPNRDKLDLIWVTTGGGKTEAYLFAIAATIFNRRLSHQDSGTSVLMRYTLRLLTAQQFERASSLIVACEYLRRNSSNSLGSTPISIGLWVGGSTTPNTNESAKDNIKDMHKSGMRSNNPIKISKFQLIKCPWCKEEDSIFKPSGNFGYRIGINEAKRKNEFHNFKCLNKACPFRNSLPVHVVDDNIYRHRPTLLFGTVDKFAQVPLNIKTKKLFGTDDKNYHPPELIIQDELHLISGPLGSMVGLYESAFDFIINNSNKKPKYIASTATIRNAQEQTKALFDRDIIQFPPPGLSAEDNYFVKEKTNSPGRKYIGVMGTGKSQITTEVRLVSALLKSVTDLNLTEKEKELYWTQTGYFNSIRELGKMTSLIKDDISQYLEVIRKRNFGQYRNINNPLELTSRISSTKIREALNKLEVQYPDPSTIDILTATNMLSVGIDISRLNSMFVVGQPKQTSEYIQATSRVGRSNLGMVYTLYNSTRSRDRSHYETFQPYHKGLYKFVEPTSVTPFSLPALEKGLKATIIAMLLHLNDRNEDPNNIIDSDLNLIKNFLKNRIENSYKLYHEDAVNYLEKSIKEIKYILNDTRDIKYYLNRGSNHEESTNYFLKGHGIKESPEASFAMNSMRDVDESSYLYIAERMDD